MFHAYTCLIDNTNWGNYVLVVISGDDSEEEEEDREVSLRAQQEQLEAEKQALLQNKELVEEVSILWCDYIAVWEVLLMLEV